MSVVHCVYILAIYGKECTLWTNRSVQFRVEGVQDIEVKGHQLVSSLVAVEK